MPSKGGAFQTIKTPTQSVYEESVIQHYPLGTLFQLGERWFRYANCGAGFGQGLVLQSSVVVGDHQQRVNAVVAPVDTNIVTPAIGATAVTAHQYVDGWCTIPKVTGLGACYKIKSHATNAGSLNFPITLYDDLWEALDATSEVTLTTNAFRGTIVVPAAANAQTARVVGVALLDVTTDYFYWCQTKGPAPVLCDTGETLIVGDECSPQTTTEVAGAVGVVTSLLSNVVGRVMAVAPAAEYALVHLDLD